MLSQSLWNVFHNYLEFSFIISIIVLTLFMISPLSVFDILNSNSHLPKKKKFICFNDSSSKLMKNAFYFILKAVFVLKIFKFLS